MKALVVDDSHVVCKIIGRILRREGFEILEAVDEEETLGLLKNPESGKADLATTGWNVPVVNGLELVVNIRAGKSLRNITLMMVTTRSGHSQTVRILAAGTHEYLIKPFAQETTSEKPLLLGLGS